MSVRPRSILAREPALVSASAATVVLVVVAVAMRLSTPAASPDPFPQRLMGALVAGALLLVGCLAIPRNAGAAWFLTAVSSALGSFEIVATVRRFENAVDSPDWPRLVLLATLSLLAASAICLAFAGRRRHGRSSTANAALGIVGLGLVATGLTGIWAASGGTSPPDLLDPAGISGARVMSRVGLATLAGALVVGLLRDFWPAVVRARAQEGRPTDRPRRLWRLLDALGEELLPGTTSVRREAIESERARLAADLHATVLPELRRAASRAEAGDAPDRLRHDLAQALGDVEQLILRRQSIVLEQFGLVAALEWLAERTEDRTPLRVELELGDGLPADPMAIEPDVRRAAFRIALLALDNVARHAGATTASIAVAGVGTELRLAIRDDGREKPSSSGGRGLVDMQAEATSSGGRLVIEATRGLELRAAWPSALG